MENFIAGVILGASIGFAFTHWYIYHRSIRKWSDRHLKWVIGCVLHEHEARFRSVWNEPQPPAEKGKVEG